MYLLKISIPGKKKKIAVTSHKDFPINVLDGKIFS